MEKFTITNADNTKMTVDLIRYFKYKNDCYLIYTLNEIDQKGYLKLYLVKIMEELGFPVIYNIKDDKEWAGMQAIVKKVIKEIKNKKRKFLEDLDYDTIQGIKISEPRFFKLDKKLANVLSSNYHVDIPNIDQSSSEVDNNSIDKKDIAEMSIPFNLEEKNTKLESMDDTLVNQGAYDPIASVPLEDPIIQPVALEKISTDISIDSYPDQTIQESDLQTQSEQLTYPNNNIDNDTNVYPEIINTENMPITSSADFIDYKSLYIAEKEEKEAINIAMDRLVEQLIKYKEKYGELE